MYDISADKLTLEAHTFGLVNFQEIPQTILSLNGKKITFTTPFLIQDQISLPTLVCDISTKARVSEEKWAEVHITAWKWFW